MIRVLIAEDKAMIRAALIALLNGGGDIEVVAEAGTGEEAVASALRVTPDVALLDLEMPVKDGFWAAEQLREKLPACRVLILTVFGRPGYLRRAVDLGAAGFVLKDAPPAELFAAVRRVAAGERVIDPKLALSALAEGTSPLTPRERDVLALSVRGASVEDMARSLHLTNGTVRSYLSIAIQKLNSKNRMEAARIAEEKGWL
ncbi:MAG TPA: response regulator transcription factor, partial [Gemmatimonadales bacterium]|nr:response regulator transcription factor [Gemmatimonadales bacterium]